MERRNRKFSCAGCNLHFDTYQSRDTHMLKCLPRLSDESGEPKNEAYVVENNHKEQHATDNNSESHEKVDKTQKEKLEGKLSGKENGVELLRQRKVSRVTMELWNKVDDETREGKLGEIKEKERKFSTKESGVEVLRKVSRVTLEMWNKVDDETRELTHKMEKIKGTVFAYLSKLFPFLMWMRTYKLDTLQGDIIAGITCGLLIIPQSIAYANLAGLPAEYGLYTAMTPGIIYCVFGTSKDVSIGPTVTMALFTYRFNYTHHPIGASALAFMVGCVLLLMAVFRLGFITKFMPLHVNNGFVSAAAVVVAVSQLKNLFGLAKPPQSFIGKIRHFSAHLGETKKWDLVLGVCCIIFLLILKFMEKIVLKKIKEKKGMVWNVVSKTLWFSCIASSGIVCVLGTIICYLVVHYSGEELFSLAGQLPHGLPNVQSPFDTAHLSDNSTMTFIDFVSSFNTGLIILPVIQFVQSVSIAKAFGKMYNYETDSTQELLALSFANMFGSFFGGWPVTGSFSGSAVNAMSGTRTPFSSVVACGLVFVACGVLMPYFYYIPKTVLGAMITMAVITMIDYKTPLRIWKVRKIDLIPYFVAFFGTFYTLETGVLAGAVVSLLIMVFKEADPKYEVITTSDGKCITIKFIGNLSYPAVESVKEIFNSQVKNHEDLNSIVVDMSHVFHIDYTVVSNLRATVEEIVRQGVSVDFINFIDANVEESFKRGKLKCVATDSKGECPIIRAMTPDESVVVNKYGDMHSDLNGVDI